MSTSYINSIADSTNKFSEKLFHSILSHRNEENQKKMKFNGFYNGIDAITFPNTFFWTRQQILAWYCWSSFKGNSPLAEPITSSPVEKRNKKIYRLCAIEKRSARSRKEWHFYNRRDQDVCCSAKEKKAQIQLRRIRVKATRSCTKLQPVQMLLKTAPPSVGSWLLFMYK